MEVSHIYSEAPVVAVGPSNGRRVCTIYAAGAPKPRSAVPLSRSSIAVRSHSDCWWSPMVALSACPGRREVVVWASHWRRAHWRRGRSGNAIGLTKIARQSAARSVLLSHRGAFNWYPAITWRFHRFPRLPWSQGGRRPVWRRLNMNRRVSTFYVLFLSGHRLKRYIRLRSKYVFDIQFQ